MIGTVALINTTTYGAGARRVARVNRDNCYACKCRLVLYKLTKLVESPVSVSCPLLAPNRYPIADALEVFKSDPAIGVLRGLHDTLTDAVVCVSLVALLLAADLAELALCRPRALALEIAAAVRDLPALVFNLLTAVLLSIAVCREVNDAEVNAEILLNVLRLRRLDLAGDEQVELAADVAQVGLASLAFQKLTLAVAAQVAHTLATFQRPDADRLFASLEAQDAAVVGERAAWPEDTLSSMVEFVCAGDFCDGPHGHLSGQVKSFPDVTINNLVEVKLPEGLRFPRLLADVVAGGICGLQRFEKKIVLAWCGLQFDLCCQFHCIETIAQKGGRRNSSPA